MNKYFKFTPTLKALKIYFVIFFLNYSFFLKFSKGPQNSLVALSGPGTPV